MPPDEAGPGPDAHAAEPDHGHAPAPKTYAAVAAEAVAAAEAEPEPGADVEPEPEAEADADVDVDVEYEYTTDGCTEDDGCSDEYNDESVFSDSNYGTDAEPSLATQPRDEAHRTGGLDAAFGSGPASPQALETAGAAAALAPSHRFVSHTPWGSSTGRLTRDQRHKTPLGPHVVNVVSVPEGSKPYSQIQQQLQREQLLQQDAIDATQAQAPAAATRIVTIAQFAKSVTRLVGIGFPSLWCTEARLVAALVAVLGARTALDVWFANFNARTVRAVVTYNRRSLLRRLLPEYLGMMLPMAAVNQAIKWTIASLTIALRVRLGHYAHDRYVDGITNITWNQLHRQGLSGAPPPATERPDWLLTVQIHRFADMLPRLLADVIKPTMDWCVFSRLLSRVIGRRGSLAMVLYVVLANVVIRMCSPPTGRHASHLALLEEKYRGVYARVSSTIQRAAAASTPLVFQAARDPAQQQGPAPARHHAFVPRVQAAFRERAKDALDGSLAQVTSSVVGANIRRFFGGIGETVLAKYGATLTAYYLLASPLCTPGRRLASEILHDPAAVMMSYSRNSAYLINLSQATTRLLLMVGDLPKFVWSTVRVDRLLRSLDVHSRYRSAVESLPPAAATATAAATAAARTSDHNDDDSPSE
ncbi:hypothetical protein H4R18_003842 [Coemansia javaensis]|uniref:ABC transmembrane type-1 domain-containing protein n=1 Tax=Coemansia javaensis TaxID=2761396 RepID=A0A9W8H7W6_9FUNG|nr:hypothetical protein H4R18_003842 [Coemansia javaensis]